MPVVFRTVEQNVSIFLFENRAGYGALKTQDFLRQHKYVGTVDITFLLTD